MSDGERRAIRFVYRDGTSGSRYGWCCASDECHVAFDWFRRSQRWTFAKFMAHRLVRHRRIRFVAWTSRTCRVVHSAPSQFVWTLTSGWSTHAWTSGGAS